MVLQLHELVRTFGDRTAVDRVSFAVPSGQLVGFVGGNGAGKTTTMRMVMGVLAATSGEVRWQGRAITASDRRAFGYMPEERGLYPKQPVLDQLVYLGTLHGESPTSAKRHATELLERFGLGERLKDKVEKLSLGNQQKVQIAAAVMGNPQALILDEPFSGLDPDAVDSMVSLLHEYTARGVPVLFSSHQLDLVDRICDRLVILARGRVVADGTSSELRQRATHHHRIVVDTDAAWVASVPGVELVSVDGPRALLTLADDAAASALLREALARGTVREFGPVVPTMAEVYRTASA